VPHDDRLLIDYWFIYISFSS